MISSERIAPLDNPLAASGLAVAVIDDDPKLRTKYTMQLGEHAQTEAYPSIEAFDAKVPPGTPMVVIFGPSLADEDGLKAVEQLTRRRPELAGVIVVEELSTAVMQQALRAGVRDVLTAPVEGGQLLEAIQRVGSTLTVAPRRPDAGTEEPAGHRGRVITVFSPKGGTGKSVLASNLAVGLKRRTTGIVALVDADLQFGDIAVMLKLTPQHTIVDAVAAIDRLDSHLLQSLLVRHDPSGVMVLPAPIEPAFADQIGATEMVQIVQLLRSFCDYVLVDTPSYFNEVVLSLLEESDDIVLVAGMDIPNIKNVKIGLQTLRLLNTPASKLKLVLNRANSKVKLDVSEVERTLQLKADALVPSDVAVPQSVNKGSPILIDSAKSGVSKSIDQLAGVLAGTEQPARRR